MSPTVRAVPILVLALILAACEHSQPFAVQDPDPLGPADGTFPVRLTFNTGPDEYPALTPDWIVYSTLDADRADRDRCLAFLPPDGGTRLSTVCPGGPVPDEWQHALLQPAPSSDNRMAFVWERSAIGAWAGVRRLQVAPIDAIDAPTLDINLLFTLPSGERIIAARQLTWTATDALRFVAGEDYIDTNNGVDTVFVPLALGEVDVGTGTFRAILGTDDAYTHGEAPDGGAWFLRTTDRRQLLHADPATGTVTVVGTFGVAVVALGVVDGVPVGFGATAGGETVVEWLDVATGVPAGSLEVNGSVQGIAGAAGSRRFVIDVGVGTARDLWLHELP